MLEIESGVPYGSVLGPILFQYCTNDMIEDIKLILRLIAGDIIAYLTITSDNVRINKTLTNWHYGNKT